MKFRNIAQKFYRPVAAAGLVAVSAGSALATPILDLTAASTAVTGELTPAIAAAMPIAGMLLAVGVGWKLYKRFCK